MFSLIQLPKLRWIPKALSASPSPQKLSLTGTKLEDTMPQNVRYFILIRHNTVLIINGNRKRSNWHPTTVFEMLSLSCYLSITYPTIKRHTIATFMIYAFRSANSKDTPSTKSMEKLRSQSTFLVVLSSPLQDTLILKIDRLKCSSPFTRRFSLG